MMKLYDCECEHASHYTDTGKKTPKGRDGHEPGLRVPVRFAVPTVYGVVWVCRDCRHDCFDSSALGAAGQAT